MSTKVTQLKYRREYFDSFAADLITQHADKTPSEQGRAILARMQRTYSHIIIDGTEYVLVPSAQSPYDAGDAA